MKRFYTLTLALAIVFTLIVSGSQLVFAQANAISGGPLGEDALLEDPEPNADGLRQDDSAVETWISKWYGPEGNYEDNGTFQVSGSMDFHRGRERR